MRAATTIEGSRLDESINEVDIADSSSAHNEVYDNTGSLPYRQTNASSCVSWQASPSPVYCPKCDAFIPGYDVSLAGHIRNQGAQELSNDKWHILFRMQRT